MNGFENNIYDMTRNINEFFFSFSMIMITRKVKINLKDMQQSPDYDVLYNQGKIKMLK